VIALKCRATFEPIMVLAEGGTAALSVAICRGPSALQHLVVLKRAPGHVAGKPPLLDEARIALRLGHPNVVPVTEVAQAGRELALVLPYVESLSFSELTSAARRARTTLRPPVVVRILCDLLAGLHAVHEARDLAGRPMSLVHGDVSPGNVIVGTDGFSRLLDFGVARLAQADDARSARLQGTLSYMAPERLLRKPVDRRSDVFSAGVLLHEALTGRQLFPASDEAAAVLTSMIARIENPSGVVAHVSRALGEVTTRALRRQPDLRYPTAQRFRDALERACTPASVTAVAEVVERLGHGTLAARRRELRRALRAAS
jgi:serine/threonine-protein kinase